MLRGRKQFQADFNAAIVASLLAKQDPGDLVIQDLRQGDDRESFVCTVRDHAGQDLAHLAFFTIPDEYPDNHVFFCSVQLEDDTYDPPAHIRAIAESVASYGSIPIDTLFRMMLRKCSTLTARSDEESVSDEANTDAAEDQDEDQYEEDYFDADLDLELPDHKLEIDWPILQRHFNETIAAGFRPGLSRLQDNEAVLSVSIPVIALASRIEPRALMARDTRLLSESQYLTLVITGLHKVYPVLDHDGSFVSGLADLGMKNLKFRIGLTPRYKPDDDLLSEIFRHPEPDKVPEDPQLAEDLELAEMLQREEHLQLEAFDGHEVGNSAATRYPPNSAAMYNTAALETSNDGGPSDLVSENPEEPAQDTCSRRFSFSLSESLELLFQERFLQTVQLRLCYGIGWAGAELLIARAERAQQRPEMMYDRILQELDNADEEESKLALSYDLPSDPILDHFGDQPNLPLIAFSYLIRRLTLCSRYCLICHNRLSVDFDALKPYVCDDPLCIFRYYNFKRGPSLEHEICTRPTTVDLLVSLAYCSASSKVLDEQRPTGIGLMVPHPTVPNGLPQRFDDMNKDEMCKAIVDLLSLLPPIADMKMFLESNTKSARVLRIEMMDDNVPPAAWLLLRWCISSCTAHIEELSNPEERISNFEDRWRQFRFVVGAPDAEAKFAEWKKKAAEQNVRAAQYPTLYAFHGSAAENWHSIIRHGLWHKIVANGRAHGNGVYFSKNAMFSINHYSRPTTQYWKNSALRVQRCVTMAEIINLPGQFVSRHPHFVVANTEWIACRYLLVESVSVVNQNENTGNGGGQTCAPSVLIDPMHPPSLNLKMLTIPEPDFKLQQILKTRRAESIDQGLDEDDIKICNGIDPRSPHEPSMARELDLLSIQEDWEHDPEWVASCTPHLFPPPENASLIATKALQRELTAMLKEQKNARRLDELGWYIPPESIGDNLFQWIIELHSFPKDLPIALDMKRESINSIVMEVDFPPTFPFAPPFFRILKPRLLPFLQRGGGHVTSGGTMCMELLTATGWLASYSIPAVIVDIKLALVDPEPHPARLSGEWRQPYTMRDAVESYKRVASVHGWKIPGEIDLLFG